MKNLQRRSLEMHITSTIAPGSGGSYVKTQMGFEYWPQNLSVGSGLPVRTCELPLMACCRVLIHTRATSGESHWNLKKNKIASDCDNHEFCCWEGDNVFDTTIHIFELMQHRRHQHPSPAYNIFYVTADDRMVGLVSETCHCANSYRPLGNFGAK